ncbi:MAG: hypothetical protein ABI574_00950 [Burkholderiales bacterium]
MANNVRLVSGALVPLAGPTTLQALTKSLPKTIWRYGNSNTETSWWFEFTADTDVIRSPIASDPWGRAYWSDGAEARYGPNSALISGSSYPGASYMLGIPKPAGAASASGTSPASGATAETRTYVYTYVSAYGEEGPPSDPSSLITIDPAAAVSLSGMSGVPSGAYNITLKRIYRSSVTDVGTEFQFVAEIAVATTTYSDTVTQSSLGEVLPSGNWVAPPATLKGLKLLPGGAAVGFVDNVLHLSEPNLPHAWPHQYPIDLTIVGIGVFRESVAVLTNGHPYLTTGSDPASMSTIRLEFPHACVSKASIVETGDGVLYASPDGLVSIGSSSMELVTMKLLTREQWLAYNPSSIKAFYHDGRYHAFYTKADGSRGLLIIDLSGQGATLTTSDFSAATDVTGGYSDPRTDTLYLAQGGSLVRFNAGSALTLTWRSRPFRLPIPTCLARAAVDAAVYPLTLRIYAGGTLNHTRSVTDANPFALPTGFRENLWQFEIEATGEVNRLRVASSIQELQAAA